MKLKICLIATWQSNYKNEKKSRSLGFPTLINLAALTPGEDVSVQYEGIKPINYNVDADLIGISFITPFAHHTFEVADKFRAKGKTVVLGGPYVTVFPDRCREHADAIVIGEAENSWPALVDDFKKGQLKEEYLEQDYKPANDSFELKLPVPRYDLVNNDFIFNQTVIATRGCPHSCDFCFLKSFTKGFRTRPVDDVIRDIKAYKGKNWFQNKIVIFWDDNLIGDIKYAKELFRKLKPLKKWWAAQVTINFAYDDELLKLAADSGCIAVYIGFESFNQESLKDIHKPQNRVEKYREITKKIHRYGIAVASGLIVGFDHDTTDVFDNSIKAMHKIGIDWVNANILVPFEPTPLYKRLKKEGRILTDHSYFYNGSAVSFRPKLMTVEQLNKGFHKMVREIFSLKNILKRSRTFLSDAPLSKIGAWFIFLLGNITYLFLERMERVMDENGNPVIVAEPAAKPAKKLKLKLKKLSLNLDSIIYSFFRKTSRIYKNVTIRTKKSRVRS